MKAGVIGATGYTGGELLRLLLNHPQAELSYVTSTQHMGKWVHDFHPNLRGLIQKKFEPFSVDGATKCDVIFLCVPHTASLGLVPQIIETGVKIIDLSADYRLRDPAVYEKYYTKHTSPELIKRFAVGVPELHREEIKKSNFAACLGCLTTATTLGLAPVVKSKKIDLERIIVDAKIGSAAAGRSHSFESHHPERVGVIRPYKLSGHRHTAEIEQEMSTISGEKITISFSAHSVDLVRGILSTIHVFPTEAIETKDLWKMYRDLYHDSPFIRIVVQPQGNFKLPDPKYVAGSNFCDIGFEIDEHSPRLILVSAIDNLVKGSGGQAVQCMNLMYGLDEKTGLWSAGHYP